MSLTNQFQWVDTDSALTAMIEALCKEPLLAVDTEFMRTDTFFPKVALIQIASRDNIYLVDPVAITTLEPLRVLFYGDQLSAIILHSCSEDLEVFKTLWREVPTKIFDTQIAAAYLNLERQPSLQKLLSLLLGVDLPKDETRSNWLQRPLTDNQMKYAALDVAYLLDSYDILIERLEAKGRLEWAAEDCETLVDKYSAVLDFDKAYKSVGNAWKLSAKQLAVLRLLSAWRDRTAIEKNKPKGHILKDATLFEIAERSPNSKSGLAQCESLSAGQAKRFGEALLKMVQATSDLAPSDYPALIEKPFSRSHKTLAKKMKEVVERKALELDVPIERMASRKLLERYANTKLQGGSLPKEFTGWRHDVLVDELNAVFLSHQEG